MTLLQKLTELMESHGDTVASLSRKSGVPYTTIDGLFKKGFTGAKISTIQAIARAYGVSLDYMIRDEIDDPMYGLGNAGLTGMEHDILEAMHQNPRLGLLFDRQRKMPPEAVENMLNLTNMIVKEFDGDESE